MRSLGSSMIVRKQSAVECKEAEREWSHRICSILALCPRAIGPSRELKETDVGWTDGDRSHIGKGEGWLESRTLDGNLKADSMCHI